MLFDISVYFSENDILKNLLIMSIVMLLLYISYILWKIDKDLMFKDNFKKFKMESETFKQNIMEKKKIFNDIIIELDKDTNTATLFLEKQKKILNETEQYNFPNVPFERAQDLATVEFKQKLGSVINGFLEKWKNDINPTFQLIVENTNLCKNLKECSAFDLFIANNSLETLLNDIFTQLMILNEVNNFDSYSFIATLTTLLVNSLSKETLKSTLIKDIINKHSINYTNPDENTKKFVSENVIDFINSIKKFYKVSKFNIKTEMWTTEKEVDMLKDVCCEYTKKYGFKNVIDTQQIRKSIDIVVKHCTKK